MTCNVNPTDRVIRIALGIAVLGAGAFFKSYWGLIGLVPLATGLLRTCPLYSLLHISTRK